jgi:hypothetical protein
MKLLIETVENLRARDIGFRSLTEAIDATTAAGWPVSCLALSRMMRSAGFCEARHVNRSELSRKPLMPPENGHSRSEVDCA